MDGEAVLGNPKSEAQIRKKFEEERRKILRVGKRWK
jgi:hypothetical protein